MVSYHRTRRSRSALAFGSRSTTAAENTFNRLVHHEWGRYSREFRSDAPASTWLLACGHEIPLLEHERPGSHVGRGLRQTAERGHLAVTPVPNQ